MWRHRGVTYIPSHTLPFPLNPAAHLHSNAPSMFLQSAYSLQSAIPLVHSSMSEGTSNAQIDIQSVNQTNSSMSEGTSNAQIDIQSVNQTNSSMSEGTSNAQIDIQSVNQTNSSMSEGTSNAQIDIHLSIKLINQCLKQAMRKLTSNLS